MAGGGVWLSLTFGRNAEGWHWAHGEEMLRLLPWRWPRTLAALSAGVMLAPAGILIQKLTANPIGSPEVLGISAGTSGAVILLLLLIPGDVFAWQFSPQRILLSGIAIGTAFTTLIKPVAQGLMVSAIGGLLMMFADWCGRMVMFPNQIPAGLLATFIGAPYFIWPQRRQGR